MKELKSNSKQLATETRNKSKQALVLMLVGCGLLSLSFLSLEREPPVALYEIVQKTGGTQWQVVSLREPVAVKELAIGKGDVHSQQKRVSSFSSMKKKDSLLPAKFALFLNRPLPLNKSSLRDLKMLPGIGPSLAAKIIAERQRKGRLSGPDDLLNISGIGPVSLQRLQPLVRFE